MINHVEISLNAKKDLKKTPKHIVAKLLAWIEKVEDFGLAEARKIKGYHDEPLKGNRRGQRSIHLSKSYRAIYKTLKDEVQFVLIKEVNKHDY